MLAMPIISSRPPKGPGLAPTITFIGPDVSHHIRAINAGGAEVARFVVSGDSKDFTVSRLAIPNSPPTVVAKGSRSSLSGKTAITLHGNVELELRDDMYYHTLKTPTMGKLRVDYGSSGTRKVIDGRKNEIAVGHTKGDPKMEVFVQGDELMLDTMLAVWVELVKYKEASDKTNKAALGVFKVVGALAGGGAGA